MNHVTTRFRSRIAFTLVEVMLAVGVLVVASVAVVGTLANLHTERAWSSDVVLARQAAVSLINLFQGTNWDDLNDRAKPDAYVTWARHVDDVGNNFLGDGLGVPANRRLPFKTGLDDLRVYVEYYRAQTAIDENGAMLSDAVSGLPCLGGVLENEIIGSTMGTGVQRRINGGLSGMAAMPSSNAISVITGPATSAALRLPEMESVDSQVGVRIAENDPVAIRIVLTWRDTSAAKNDGTRRMMLSLITGKSR